MKAILLVSLCLIAVVLGAADIDGQWKGPEEGNNDADFTFSFGPDPAGTLEGPRGPDQSKFTFSNNQTATPYHTIDITYVNGTFSGKVALGIYQIRGTTNNFLRLALAYPGATERPVNFTPRPAPNADRVWSLLKETASNFIKIH